MDTLTSLTNDDSDKVMKIVIITFNYMETSNG